MYPHPMLRVVCTPRDALEADVVRGRLNDAGILTVVKRSVGSDLPQFGGGGARYVYVEDRDFDRANAVLNEPPPSDQELAELSAESYREATGHDPPPD